VSYLKTSFISKESYKSSHLQKTPLKFRDSEFDFIVKDSFLHNFIASTHKNKLIRLIFTELIKMELLLILLFKKKTSTRTLVLLLNQVQENLWLNKKLSL
ncbi:hypothetical protein OLR75_01290, partial [Campylobacter jejuni]|nr:hypothetical protein [Campylobacter jejuni]